MKSILSKSISILGATGSIGLQTLEIVDLYPEQFQVFALSCHHNVAKAIELTEKYQPQYLVITDKSKESDWVAILKNKIHKTTTILWGEEYLNFIAAHESVDLVMCAIVGFAGLPSIWAAAEAGKTILLANKESLVVAGHLLMPLIAKCHAKIIPIDSEHNAIFQCLPALLQHDIVHANFYKEAKTHNNNIKQLILTASGGPFLKLPLSEFEHITPAQACKHPTWTMGQKISIDSATMMNKGLEWIEAFWLFNTENIKVLIHPQSIIHSMVDFIDGSVLAQLSCPSMHIPIGYGLSFSDENAVQHKRFKLPTMNLLQAIQESPNQNLNLELQTLDTARYPCFQLCLDAHQKGGNAPLILNAANELAVTKFLNGMLKYTEIASFIENKMEQFYNPIAPQTLQECVMQHQQLIYQNHQN